MNIKQSLSIILLGLGVSQYASANGATPQPSPECFQYVYEHEMSFGRNKREALGHAVQACDPGTRPSCLNFYLDAIHELHPHQSAFEQWGEALRACRGIVWRECLDVANEFWKNQYHDKYLALKKAVTTCNTDVRQPCLEYVFKVQKSFNHPELKAFLEATNVCTKGVSQACLQHVYEHLMPEAYPQANAVSLWNMTIESCTKN